jgi:hypothetical protein
MRSERAGAAFPNALSFARMGMAALVAGRWRIEKLRVELDAEGRGEVLYRFTGCGWTFHFFVVSMKLPEEVKIDRNFAQSWDAMGVLCQGEWTPERERLLRQEVPKQRAGRADYDTLMYARGNRSGRLFEHVVESLAAGVQPNLARISSVGYILRTTAFIGNGQLGTRPLAGYEPDHPFRAPYHAQMASAFLLREYVFDLVDVMARARNPSSARLCRSYRRYLGLGNSAATGLVAYLTSHPLLVDRWQHTWEKALAAARARGIRPGSHQADRLLALLGKAQAYFHEAAGTSGEDVLADRLRVAHELAEAAAALQAVTDACLADTLWHWAARHAAAETIEVVAAILIETAPDIVSALACEFQASEEMELDPSMRVEALRLLVQERFNWALAPQEEAEPYFWYRAAAAPRDVRRGFRGIDPALERETPMDVGLLVRRLAARLEEMHADATVGNLVACHPDLRRIVTRVQATAQCSYAELRDELLSMSFSPFAPIRLILAYYGMDKFESAYPKSVRGALLQGAPIAEDVAGGRDGDWPFPLRPMSSDDEPPGDVLAAPCPSHPDPVPCAPIVRDWLAVAPIELVRASTAALVGAGVELGVAEEVSRLVELAEGLRGDGTRLLVEHLAQGRVRSGKFIALQRVHAQIGTIEAGPISPLVTAPITLDLACATAARAGRGTVLVRSGPGTSAACGLAVRAAERGYAAVAIWRDVDTGASGAAAAAPGEAPRDCTLCELALGEVFDAPRIPGGDHLLDCAIGEWLETASSGYVVYCARPEFRDGALDVKALLETPSAARSLARERASWNRQGFRVHAGLLRALEQAGIKSWLTSEEELRVRPDGFDPLRSF